MHLKADNKPYKNIKSICTLTVYHDKKRSKIPHKTEIKVDSIKVTALMDTVATTSVLQALKSKSYAITVHPSSKTFYVRTVEGKEQFVQAQDQTELKITGLVVSHAYFVGTFS